MDCNQVALSGRLLRMQALRYTPAGIPRIGFVIEHASEQIEAGGRRKVQCEANAVALGDVALQAARMKAGDSVRVEGFLVRRSMNSQQLVLHVNRIELV